MASYAVIDATSPKATGHITGHAARWLLWELQRSGAEIVSPSQASVVLVTCVSTDIWRSVPRELRRAGVDRSRTKIILGGHAAMTPAIFDGVVDVACVGEGAHFVRTLLGDGYDAAVSLPEAWAPGETRDVVPNYDYPWEMPPSDVGDDGIRIIAERGCSRRCLFCGIGWGQPHIKAPYDVGVMIDELLASGYTPHVSANDLGAMPLEWTAGRYTSVSYQALAKWFKAGKLPRTEIFRIGVEGPSERLRAAVGKPIPEDGLWDVTYRAIAAGHKVKWQLIAGLPGETDEDLDEVRRHIRRARDLPRSVLMLSWTSYVPHPATPLSVLPLDDSYGERYARFMTEFHRTELFTRRAWLGKGQGPKRRLQGAMAHTGATEAQLRTGWATDSQPNWRVRYMAEPTQLRRTAQRYADKVFR